MQKTISFFALAISLFTRTAAHAEDWPEFRGPTGQGVVAKGSLPTEWNPEKNVTWKQAIPGTGWSSPVVVGGKVYLTTAKPLGDDKKKDIVLEALCLDAKSGKILWEKEVFKPDPKKSVKHPKNSHASPTPIVQDGRVYVHFGHQGTACLDLDGQIVWQNQELTYNPVHGNGGSPILVDDALIFSCDGGDKRFIAALDRSYGKVLWKTDREGKAGMKFSFSTPLCITVNGKKQIISPGSNSVNAYDPVTGKEIWHVTYVGYSVIPRPVYGHGLIFMSTGFMTPSLMAIKPDGQGDVTETHVAWKTSKAAPTTPSPLLVGDELYMVSDTGTASCLDAKTGQVHWQERLGGGYSASPICADGKIYFQNEKGVGTVVKAGTKFESLAKNDMGEPTLASYAVADGALFIRTEKHLYRIEGR
ncbi:MAG TPA: PQQ-binding-like beta-propeller repeat protein [Gemmataceae bacterium]|jgi:outer membrane protein assembly factor BamB|nr:PQQ-binding-like beta-propeller repeat protein [Gemmataceae bacterium]